MDADSVTAVIPNWNRAALLAKALDSLRRQIRPPEEIVVVDNGSTDNSVDVARAAGARVMEMGSNAGFARAVNAGIEAAGGEFIAIVNNDVELEPAWLETLYTNLAGSRYSFATGKLGHWGARGGAGKDVRTARSGMRAGRSA